MKEMYGKYVWFEGQRVWVWCCPDTPYEELMRKAANVVTRIAAYKLSQ